MLLIAWLFAAIVGFLPPSGPPPLHLSTPGRPFCKELGQSLDQPRPLFFSAKPVHVLEKNPSISAKKNKTVHSEWVQASNLPQAPPQSPPPSPPPPARAPPSPAQRRLKVTQAAAVMAVSPTPKGKKTCGLALGEKPAAGGSLALVPSFGGQKWRGFPGR